MEENTKRIESLLDGAIEYGKTSFELAKLKAIAQASDAVSSFIPHSLVIIVIASSLFFLSVGVALWLGEILGKIFYGFFVLTAFYGIIGAVLHFLMRKWLKKIVSNYIVKQVFK